MTDTNRPALLLVALILIGCGRSDDAPRNPRACEESVAEISFLPESDFSASLRCDVSRRIMRLAAQQGNQRLDSAFAEVSTLTLAADTSASRHLVLMLRYGDLGGPQESDSSIVYVLRDSVAFRVAIYPVDEEIVRAGDSGRIGMDSLFLPLCALGQMDGSSERIDVLISIRDGGVDVRRRGEACRPQRYVK